MELYQRVKQVAVQLTGSVPQLAKGLGKEVRTFQGYLNAKRQDNLWPILPELLDSFPRLSRQWLYFGEGPMLIGHGVPLDQPVPLRAIVEAVEAMAKEAGGTNEALLHYVAGLPLPKVKDFDITADRAGSSPEVRLMKAMEEMNALKTKIIDLQEELLAMHRGHGQELRTCGTLSSGAPGVTGAAPFLPHNSDK